MQYCTHSLQAISSTYSLCFPALLMMSVFLCSPLASLIDSSSSPPLQSINTEFGGEKNIFRNDDSHLRIFMWFHVHMRTYIQYNTCLCICVYSHACTYSPMDATSHPWQQNTLIFPTLIVKKEVERTEDVWVCVERG